MQTGLDGDVSLVGAVALGVGTTTAAGIFVGSGLAVSSVGGAAIVSLLLAVGAMVELERNAFTPGVGTKGKEMTGRVVHARHHRRCR
ncbi:hypothetical protein [Halomicrococcus gelatinilyticus]|uniref:hypothetical protein n=1 Tax=Halomicrococcus gelatinilyticus TaxID=1702103 RepID=UPI002E134800